MGLDVLNEAGVGGPVGVGGEEMSDSLFFFSKAER